MLRDRGERMEEAVLPRVLIKFSTLSLFLVFVAAAQPRQPDLVFVQIGAARFGDSGVRTVFRLSNEGTEPIEGSLLLTAADGTSLHSDLVAVWTTKGESQIEQNRADFTIPAGSTLRLIMQPGNAPAIGWASLSRAGPLNVQTLLQYAEGLSGAGPIFNFEEYIIRQIESHPVISGRSFVFPVSLYYGFQTLNTAFALVNLSAAPALAELTLRPDNLESVELRPGEIFSDYFDEFWTFAVPEIFPLRLEQLASVTSDAPLGLAVFSTIQGLPLSAVSVIPKEESPAPMLEVTLDTEFELKVGDTAVIEDEDLHIQFWNVPEDSRCPSDVNCVWEGQARVTLRVARDGEEQQEIEVIARGGLGPAPVRFGDYTIELIRIEPVPISTKMIGLDEYVIILVARRVPE